MFKKESQKKDKQFRFPFRRHKKEATSTIHFPRSGGDITTDTPLTPPPPQPKKPAIDIPPNELWDRAYDDLKEAESSSKLIEAYEAILSLELSSEVVDENGSKKDGSQRGQTERQVQMNTLLDNGLKRTAKLSEAESGLSDAINIVLSLKDALDLGLKAVPVAAAAWSGICVALQIFLNPSSEMASSREGIVIVVRNMKWYSSLTSVLYRQSPNEEEHFGKLREQLAEQILDLYKVLLGYIIKTVCAHYRNLALHIARDLLKLDDWTGALDEAKKAVDSVKETFGQFNSTQTNVHLKDMRDLQASEAEHKRVQQLFDIDMAAEIEDLQHEDILLPETCKWVLNSDEYQEFNDWNRDNMKKLLWVRGDPGKGKTMLLISIVKELTVHQKTCFDDIALSYFFCRATDERQDTATAVLKGLVWMLLHQNRSLIRHLDRFDDQGPKSFGDRQAFDKLKDLFISIVDDPKLGRTYLVIDGLDECRRQKPGLRELLRLISETLKKTSQIKWLVSSRNETVIDAEIRKQSAAIQIRLEDSKYAGSVETAIDIYIDRKVSELIEFYQEALDPEEAERLKEKFYGDDGLKTHLKTQLQDKADGTFLWVALVVKDLKNYPASAARERVKHFPPGLDEVYERMLARLGDVPDAAMYRRVLLIMATAYGSLHLSELETFADLSAMDGLKHTVRSCGLLAVKESNGFVHFVHTTAKEYLVHDPIIQDIPSFYPGGYIGGHHIMTSKSLDIMNSPGKLRRNICNLPRPDSQPSEIESLDSKPLGSLRYACLYWIEHICSMGSSPVKTTLFDGGAVHQFWKEHFLHWLEALSLLEAISTGIFSTLKFMELLKDEFPNLQLVRLVQDSYRFILSYRFVIEEHPLQIYSSALIFAPTESLVRNLFERNNTIDWISTKPAVQATWGACMQTLYGHRNSVHAVAFSNDGRLIASGSSDGTVKIWQSNSGSCQDTWYPFAWVESVAFSHDDQYLAIGMEFGRIQIWHIETGECLKRLEGHSKLVVSLAFSHDSSQIVSGSVDKTVKIWNCDIGRCVKTLQGHTDCVTSVAFLQDSTHIVSASHDSTVRVWDSEDGSYTTLLEGGPDWVIWSIAVMHDKSNVICGSSDGTIFICGLDGGQPRTLKGHLGEVSAVTMSKDDTRIISGSEDHTVKVWDFDSGSCIETLEGHGHSVSSVAIWDDGLIASASIDDTIRVWKPSGDSGPLETLKRDANIRTFACSDEKGVSGFDDGTIEIWDSGSGKYLQDFEGHEDMITLIAFSRHGRHFASAAWDGMVKIWETSSGNLLASSGPHDVHKSFDPRDKIILADAKFMPWDPSDFSDLGIPEPLHHYSLSENGQWIQWKGQNVLWLPNELRPKLNTCCNNTPSGIAICCQSNRVVIFNFEVDRFPL